MKNIKRPAVLFVLIVFTVAAILWLNSSNDKKDASKEEGAPTWRFFKPSLSPARTRFKEITHWAKIGFCQSFLFMQRPLINNQIPFAQIPIAHFSQQYFRNFLNNEIDYFYSGSNIMA
jgi:hypothetical protein